MSIFMSKRTLYRRIRSIEDALGLFYVPREDKHGYDEHKVEQDGYEIIPKLQRTLKELEEKKTGKK